MSQPMLNMSLAGQEQGEVQLNLLPCRVHHDGDIDAIEPYWNPTKSTDGPKTAYFRGRKLHGKTVKLPAGYRGSVAEKGETKRETTQTEPLETDADLEELPEAIEVAALTGQAKFDELVIWGHESTADSGTDPYIRSIEEWVSFTEQLHSYPSLNTESK
ncbi:putative Ribonuclease H2 subunit C [Seiridium cardinale]